jgi:hypothetical protein
MQFLRQFTLAAYRRNTISAPPMCLNISIKAESGVSLIASLTRSEDDADHQGRRHSSMATVS